MFKVTVIGINSAIRQIDDDFRSEIKRLGQSVFTEVKKRTPVDTGTARAGWKSKNNSQGFEISNQVPYIGVLDKGRHMTNRGLRGSKQAPQGIIGPSLKSIKGKN